MYISITAIRLKSIWHFFRLSLLALHIVKQLKSTKGLHKFKKTGIGKMHYTLTVWESEEAMKRFYTEASHRNAMNNASAIAAEIWSYSYTASEIPDWKSAKRLVQEFKYMFCSICNASVVRYLHSSLILLCASVIILLQFLIHLIYKTSA